MPAKPPATPPVKSRSRFWKWLLQIGTGAIICAGLYIAYIVIEREVNRRIGERELADTFAELDARDPNWRWEKLNAARKRLPDEQNSAALIAKIKPTVPQDWSSRWREVDAAGHAELAPNIRLPARLREQLHAILATAGEPIRLSRLLKDLPHGYREIILQTNPLETPLPYTQFTREVSNLLKWTLWVALEEGDYSHTRDDLMAALNASRSIGDEPFLISQLVRIATRNIVIRSVERALAQTDKPAHISALGLPAFQEALAQDSEEPLLLYGSRGDRAAFDVLLQHLGDHLLELDKLAGQKSGDTGIRFRVAWWVYGGRFASDRAFCLRWFNVAVDAAGEPVHEQFAGFDQLEPMAIASVKTNPLTKLLPAVNKVAEAQWRSVAEARCCVVGIACERYRLKHGRWPDSLAALCPEFLATIPVDPFGGQPLLYTKQDDGVIVHSVGPKRTADRSRRLRAGLPDEIEIGFRLWNPESRRQPTPPAPNDDNQP
jgi:hypothetical protein